MQTVSKIWMDGELVDWDKAQVHVLTHALHYGTAVLEGIRVYSTDQGRVVFRLTDHIKRLADSSKLIALDLKYSVDELVEATKTLLRETGLEEGYVRPLVYRGFGEMGVNPLNNPTQVLIACWPWGAYHSPEAAEKGIRVCVSSWERINDNSLPPASKTTANYMNSALAKIDSLRAGFEDAIMLNNQGFVTEATAMNLFSVKDGVITTPPLSSGALRGLRRDAAIKVARDLGYDVKEENLRRTDLYLSDELFATGTAAEVTPIRSVDDRVIGPRGPITAQIQGTMSDVVRGRVDKYKDWAEYV
jgi:branched-chain amino acid aminotransferase